MTLSPCERGTRSHAVNWPTSPASPRVSSGASRRRVQVPQVNGTSFNPCSTDSSVADTQVIPLPLPVGAWTEEPGVGYRGRHRLDWERRVTQLSTALTRRLVR